MTPKQFFYVILAVIGVTAAAGGAGYYYALERLTTAKASYAAALGEQTAQQEQIDNLVKLKVRYTKDIEPQLPLIDRALPRTKNQTELLGQLQVLAKNVGLNISGATFPAPAGLPTQISQTTSMGTYLALPVSFEVQGNFAQLQSFITSLEKLNRFTNITSLAVSRPDKSKPISYAITLNAYVKP